ncbi:MFS transporter [Microbacterium sp. SORGH_AS_0421]|uniref:MFS transporter n=1 Tax=Microbacterium sp. SORGH_AS_0421 TaxID=3041768 RepID=UPI0027908FA3|nr:MFS transporter [Microbacterium sp. SORGH_AS_0421]MDQ1175641.1 MFS family permease [Microbacterium sp. SORGH_AS_0421]
MLLARRWVPADEPSPTASARQIDLLGALLLGAGVLCLLFPIVETGQGGGPVTLLLLLPAAGFLFALVRHEARLTKADAGPLLDLRLFRVRSFVTGVVFAVVFFCSNTGIPLVLALYYQNGLGFTALQSGLGVTAYAIGSVVGAPVAGRFVSRVGRPLLVGAVAVFTGVTIVLGLLVQSGADATDPVGVILRLCVPLFVLGVAGGAIVTPNQTLTLADVDPRRGGVAGGVVQTAQRVGSSIGQTVLGTTFALAVVGAAQATGPGDPAGDPGAFARALTLALAVSVVFSGSAILLSAVEVHRQRRH